jgi:enoyl-CoA hydratase/3-hydroxyacyl-CoA dehydrogenase
MIVGVIGSGSIGPDLAYGFLSALGRVDGARVYLNDIQSEALEAGVARIKGYLHKGVSRGKLSAKAAADIESKLHPTLKLSDLADCSYVLEAATEHLPIKKQILAQIESVVSPQCLIGFATSGIPRHQIAAEATHAERCFVNHPFFPAWRSLPIEVVGGGDQALTNQMLTVMTQLGKVPVLTADVECFAADDIFCNYISEAARIVEEGIANPAQVDRIINDAVGGGGPFNVMDLTRGNLLTVHCQELMRDAETGSAWFEPPQILSTQGNDLWHNRKAPLDARYDEALREVVLNRMMAVLFGRTFFVLDQKICEAADLDWMTRTALGFSTGILTLARAWGMPRVHSICTQFQSQFEGFKLTKSVIEQIEPKFAPNLRAHRDGEIEVITIQRPEAKNALNAETLADLRAHLEHVREDDNVSAVVLTGHEGALAGADINELAELKTLPEAEALCLRGQAVLNYIEDYPKLIMMAVNGPVMGGGAELSMACHGRVVGPRTIVSQPEVNLGIIPGYGGTQRLPRLVGPERAWKMLRDASVMYAGQAVEWGWARLLAESTESSGVVTETVTLARRILAGDVKIDRINTGPVTVTEALPEIHIAHRSLVIDHILQRAFREGLRLPLREGLALEARFVGEAVETVDCDIGMKNFAQNGPRTPALFMHE